jgi:cytochrome oxidase assembly protein ShyY1
MKSHQAEGIPFPTQRAATLPARRRHHADARNATLQYRLMAWGLTIAGCAFAGVLLTLLILVFPG